MTGPFLPKSGGYRNLTAFRLTEIIFDLTIMFTERFIPIGSRTTDQMVQAARSGRQNIAEGSAAASTSKETEIKLTNVARASLEELKLDYEDYLRQHSLAQWNWQSQEVERIRAYTRTDEFMADPMKYAHRYPAEKYCNLCITLINQAQALLRRLLERQQQQFLEQGGIKELMYKARTESRANRTNLRGNAFDSNRTSPIFGNHHDSNRTGRTSQTGPTDGNSATSPTSNQNNQQQ